MHIQKILLGEFIYFLSKKDVCDFLHKYHDKLMNKVVYICSFTSENLNYSRFPCTYKYDSRMWRKTTCKLHNGVNFDLSSVYVLDKGVNNQKLYGLII